MLRPSLFGREEKILYKQHIVQCLSPSIPHFTKCWQKGTMPSTRQDPGSQKLAHYNCLLWSKPYFLSVPQYMPFLTISVFLSPLLQVFRYPSFFRSWLGPLIRKPWVSFRPSTGPKMLKLTLVHLSDWSRTQFTDAANAQIGLYFLSWRFQHRSTRGCFDDTPWTALSNKF